VFEYRDAMPVTGKHSIRSLGARPTEAAENLKTVCDGGTFEVAGDRGEGVVEKGAIEDTAEHGSTAQAL